ncbi:MAG: Lrp/AsnC family transcriptional regulator [Candidatus Cryptobacteroides sp.]
MSQLDATDVAILKLLQEDATLSTRQIAQRVNLSPTPVFERIRRLRSEGYIRKVAAVLDEEKLGCSFVAFCYIKMQQHTFENARKIMEAVQKIDEIAECYNVSGDYDFLMKVYVSSMKEYQEFVLRILGELDCIGGLNSCFVMGEVKNTYSIPVRAFAR